MAWQWRQFLLNFYRRQMAATNCLCQYVLNQKLSCKFEEWCKFSSHVKAKPCKARPACATSTVNFIFWIFTVIILEWCKRNCVTLKLNILVLHCYRTQLHCTLQPRCNNNFYKIDRNADWVLIISKNEWKA